MEDNILTDGAIKKMTLNTLFERYMATREPVSYTHLDVYKRQPITMAVAMWDMWQEKERNTPLTLQSASPVRNRVERK